MRWQLVFVLLPVLAGCGGMGNPANPDPLAGSFDQPQRDGQAINLAGTVTLNGLTNTDPNYEGSPFGVTFAGKSGDVVLMTLSPQAVPTATNNVRCKLVGATTTYPTQNYNTVGATNYLPVLLTKTEPVTLDLYNSNTETGTLFNQACRWTGSVRTAATVDPGEPNDDEDLGTTTDRTMATPILLGTPITRVLYYRSASGLDEEDWYKLTLPNGFHYITQVTPSNGIWGGWNLSLAVYDSTGSLDSSATWTSSDTGSKSTFTTPTSTQTYYIRVSGTPVYRRGSSLDFQEYSLSVVADSPPVVSSVSPTIGVAGSTVQFHAVVSGHVNAVLWDFAGAGVIQSGGTTTDPTVVLYGAGSYNCSFIAYDDDASTFTSHPFTLQVGAVAPAWTHLDLPQAAVSVGYVALAPLPGNRLGVAYVDSSSNRLRYLYSGPGIPTGTGSWTSSYYLTGTNQSWGQPSLTVVNGVPVIAYYNQASNILGVARSTVALPSSAAQWSVKNIDVTGGGHNPTVIDLGGRIGVAHYDLPNTALRFSRALTDAPALPTDWQHHVVDNSNDTGGYLSAAMCQGRPAIAYSDSAGSDYSQNRVKFALANSSTPTAATDWPKYSLVDGVIPYGISLSGSGASFGCAVYDSFFSKTLFFSTSHLPTAQGDWYSTGYLPTRVTLNHHCTEMLGGRWLFAGCEQSYSALHVERASIPTPYLTSQWTDSYVIGGSDYPASCTATLLGQLVVAAPSLDGIEFNLGDCSTW